MRRLVIDGRSLRGQRDGLATYLGELAPRIVSEAHDTDVTIIANPATIGYWEAAAPAANVIVSDSRPMWPGQNVTVPRLLNRLRPDAYFYPAHDPPMLTRVPFVFVIQDVISHTLRPYYERLDRSKRAYSRAVTEIGLRRAARVLVPSEATREAVADVFGRRVLERIDVVPLAAGPAGPATTIPEQRSRLLYVGTDLPQKNLRRLVLAYAEAAQRLEDPPVLEIVGQLRRADDLQRLVESLGLGSKVAILGHLSDAALEQAYARAVALVIPSLAEGFGLTILEAMARSIPVVTSNCSACAEVAGDAAVLVDPFDVSSIADGIVTVATQSALRASLVRKASKRAEQFSWDRCAAQTLQSLRRVAATD